jgi:GDPmannose 4,6-dehydratase
VYQAGTSEMFGNSIDDDGFQRETTPFKPANPYAVAKVFAHQICVNYRNSYNLFVCNGILFNHESPRRGKDFVTSKVVREAVKISLGLENKLELGTLSTSRDWGNAKDYTKAMWMILQHNTPDDYICSTGVTHSIEYLCEYVFNKLNLDYKQYVSVSSKYSRPEETRHLKGDSTKLRKTLGWEPDYTFESMIDEMIEYYKSLHNPQIDTTSHDITRLSDIHGWI